MITDLIGHEDIVQFFEKIMDRDNVSHAYCFSGPEKVGKRTFAQRVCARLLKRENGKLSSHPDFFLVEREKNEKTDKTKQYIDIDQIRELRQGLTRQAAMGGYMVAIIDHAERMNTAASNALLKILEEPHKKIILFLITDNEQTLLPTIRSRCQTFYFHPVNEEKIKTHLETQGYSGTTAQDLARLSRGLPGLAIAWHTEPERYETYTQEVERFLSLLGKPFAQKLRSIEDLFADKSDHIHARSGIEEILDLWEVLLRDILYSKQGWTETTIHRVAIPSFPIEINVLLPFSKAIETAKELLNRNIHPRLLVEHVLLALP